MSAIKLYRLEAHWIHDLLHHANSRGYGAHLVAFREALSRAGFARPERSYFAGHIVSNDIEAPDAAVIAEIVIDDSYATVDIEADDDSTKSLVHALMCLWPRNELNAALLRLPYNHSEPEGDALRFSGELAWREKWNA